VAELEVFDDRRCLLGEGPHYDERTGRVFWVDILAGRVLWRDVDGAGVGELAAGGHVGAAVPRRDGGLVLCLPDGPRLLDPDGSVHPLRGCAEADADAGLHRAVDAPALRSNDAKADPAGRLWLGTMAYDTTPGAAALYRLDPGAAGPTRVLGDITISNGLGWSPGGGTMYYIDSPTWRIDAFDYDVATGRVGGRRPFVRVDDPGMPDGLCVDAEGGVWVALWQGAAVHRYTPDGRLDRVVPVPTSQVTSCAFAGEGYRLLVVTTAAEGRPPDDAAAGLTYAYRPGDVVGLPADRYAG
jgi:sugar lactone lactonase YvrE